MTRVPARSAADIERLAGHEPCPAARKHHVTARATSSAAQSFPDSAASAFSHAASFATTLRNHPGLWSANRPGVHLRCTVIPSARVPAPGARSSDIPAWSPNRLSASPARAPALRPRRYGRSDFASSPGKPPHEREARRPNAIAMTPANPPLDAGNTPADYPGVWHDSEIGASNDNAAARSFAERNL